MRSNAVRIPLYRARIAQHEPQPPTSAVAQGRRCGLRCSHTNRMCPQIRRAAVTPSRQIGRRHAASELAWPNRRTDHAHLFLSTCGADGRRPMCCASAGRSKTTFTARSEPTYSPPLSFIVSRPCGGIPHARCHACASGRRGANADHGVYFVMVEHRTSRLDASFNRAQNSRIVSEAHLT